MDDTFNPEKRCLEVAEKIIACLNDGAIIERFQSIKKNIFANYGNQNSSNIQSHLKKVSYENIELSNRLSELQQKAIERSQQDLNSYSISVLNDYINLVSPKPYNRVDSIETASSLLVDILDAKTEANSLIRTKLNDENISLRDKISRAEAVANEEIKESNKRRLETSNSAKKRQDLLNTEMSKIRTKVQQQHSRYDDLIEANNDIDASMREKSDEPKVLTAKLQETEQRKAVAEKRLKSLLFNFEKIENQTKAKEREIESKRATQRFGINDITETDLAIIRQLEQEISECSTKVSSITRMVWKTISKSRFITSSQQIS